MPDKNLLSLKSIQNAVDKIIEYASSHGSADDLYANQRDFDAIMMNFVIIGEMVVRLDDEFTASHKQVDWARIKKFRNIVAHNYFGIDAEEVWQIIQKHIPELQTQTSELITEFEHPED